MSGKIPKRMLISRKKTKENSNVNKAGNGRMLNGSIRNHRCIAMRVGNYLQKLYRLPSFSSLYQSPQLSQKQVNLLRKMSSLRYVNKIEEYVYDRNTPYAIVYIRQEDFKNGSVRITKPGIYVLQEDIVFNPNEQGDFQPRVEDIQSGKYPIPGPYQLGFFAAVTIESNDVIFDLNGHSIQQSKKHFLQQRFYANIQLGSSPFIMNQGPSSGITGSYKAPTDFVVMNGTLGLSSHHGIHGNLMTNGVLYNLDIAEFQVAGIALNGAVNSILCDISIHDTTGVKSDSVGVPVLFTYSQGRFIRSFLQSLRRSQPDAFLTIQGENKTIETIIQELSDAMDTTFDAFIHQNNEALIPDVFRNVSRLSDGNVYGLLLHVKGVAVNGLLESRPEGDNIGNREIFIKNINIKNIHSSPIETIMLTKYENVDDFQLGYNNKNIMKGPVGDVFDIMFNTSLERSYKENVLANAQLILAKYKILNIGTFGTTYIEQDIIDWAATQGASIDDIVKECPEGGEEMDGDKIVYKEGGDAMAHVMKGNFGLFISGGKTIRAQNVVVNESTIDSDVLPPHKDTNLDILVVASEDVAELENNITFDSIHIQ